MIATLEQLGWKPCFQEALDALGRSELEAARIATEHKGLYRLYSAHGELSARLSGNMFARVEAGDRGPLSAIGSPSSSGVMPGRLWDSADGLKAEFWDIEALAARCRFRDCAHDGEPGCAVQAALKDGTLPAGRLISYKKLQRELVYLERKQNRKTKVKGKKK
ncbi:hypothetical protein [Caenibacillus caldisaponilyticus]|uniref:hypothetical protein n=1 Tax=Caenibacillus caldisaponilyticus TaxID=1674942 RepID=UPI0011781B9D|nr:hypothetical protein [Caenibacillus caldisaponilyticus]